MIENWKLVGEQLMFSKDELQMPIWIILKIILKTMILKMIILKTVLENDNFEDDYARMMV